MRGVVGGMRLAGRLLSCSYGPSSGYAIVERATGPIFTRSGEVLIREMDLPSGSHSVGARLVKGACLSVTERNGQGASSVSVITSSIIEYATRLLAAGWDGQQLASELRSAVPPIVEFLRSLSVGVDSGEMLEDVCVTATGDTTISKVVSQACFGIGKNGTVVIEDGLSTETTYCTKPGYRLDSGVLSDRFLSSDSVERKEYSPLISLVDGVLSDVEDVREMLEVSSQWPDNHLVVVALDVRGAALSTMLTNDNKGNIRCCAVRCPGRRGYEREYLDDLSAVSGATVVDRRIGMDLRRFSPEWLGSVKEVKIGRRESFLVQFDNRNDQCMSRSSSILLSCDDTEEEKRRASGLSGGTAVISVGGTTDADRKVNRAAAESALASARVAVKSGVLPGGGLAYSLAASRAPATGGGDIIRVALGSPLKRISGERWMEADAGRWVGFDVVRSEVRSFMERPSIIDPCATVIDVILSSVSVAAEVISSVVVLTK